MSQEVEHEQRRKIQELERELAASEEIQCRQWLVNTYIATDGIPSRLRRDAPEVGQRRCSN